MWCIFAAVENGNICCKGIKHNKYIHIYLWFIFFPSSYPSDA